MSWCRHHSVRLVFVSMRDMFGTHRHGVWLYTGKEGEAGGTQRFIGITWKGRRG